MGKGLSRNQVTTFINNAGGDEDDPYLARHSAPRRHRSARESAQDRTLPGEMRQSSAEDEGQHQPYDDEYYTASERRQIEATAKKNDTRRNSRSKAQRRPSFTLWGSAKKKKAARHRKGQSTHQVAPPGSSGRLVDEGSDNEGSPRTAKYSGKIKWRRGELLGTGAYGNVYLGLNQDTGELMGAKQILLRDVYAEDVHDHIRALRTEISLMKELVHPNIVRYWGSEMDDLHHTLTIFMEYVSGGSVSALLNKFGPFNERVTRLYTGQILSGLDYLHSHRIMHRDIKGANILVDHAGVCKLADFGASKRLDMLTNAEGDRSLKGTPYWMAPEVVKQTGHGRQADIWSVGCTIIEMATGKPPFSQFKTHVAVLFHIAVSKQPPPFPSSLSEEGHDFLALCLQHEAKSRPSARTLLRHMFVCEEGPQPNTIEQILKNNEHNYSDNSYTGLAERLGDSVQRDEYGDSIRRTLTPDDAPWVRRDQLNTGAGDDHNTEADLGEDHRQNDRYASHNTSLASNFEWDEGVSTSAHIDIGMELGSPAGGRRRRTLREELVPIDSFDTDSEEDVEGLEALAASLGISDGKEKQPVGKASDAKKSKSSMSSKIAPSLPKVPSPPKEDVAEEHRHASTDPAKDSTTSKRFQFPSTRKKGSRSPHLTPGKQLRSPSLSPSAAIMTTKTNNSDVSWYLDDDGDRKQSEVARNAPRDAVKTTSKSLHRVFAGLTASPRLSLLNNNTTLVSPIVRKNSTSSSTDSTNNLNSQRIVLDDDLSRNFDVRPSPRTALQMQSIWDDDHADASSHLEGGKKTQKKKSSPLINAKKTPKKKKKIKRPSQKKTTSPVVDFKA